MEIEQEEMKTLSQCIKALQRLGFSVDFRVEQKKLQSAEGEKKYDPDEVSIVNFYRFEGESDPADSAVLYAIETNDGVKGSLSDAFGVYANSGVTEFMSNVEEISKKTTIHE
jgi:hypothetical protein